MNYREKKEAERWKRKRIKQQKRFIKNIREKAIQADTRPDGFTVFTFKDGSTFACRGPLVNDEYTFLI